MQAWLEVGAALGEAVSASSNAAFTAQSELCGWFSQLLAANPDIPMAALEGAHQMHDLSIALADANATLWRLLLAPFGVRTHGAETTVS